MIDVRRLVTAFAALVAMFVRGECERAQETGVVGRGQAELVERVSRNLENPRIIRP
jgi:hypothetical protein